MDPAHKVLPQETEGLMSEGDGENPKLGSAAAEDSEGNPSSGDRLNATHCGGGRSLEGAESPNEEAPSVLAHNQQVNLRALALEEKIAQIKAKMQQHEESLENLQLQ